MTISFLDPRATASAAIETYDATLQPIAVGDRLILGLLANGFPDSDNFLRCVEKSLLDRLPDGTSAVFLNKGNASAAATPAQIESLATSVHAVITAYGH